MRRATAGYTLPGASIHGKCPTSGTTSTHEWGEGGGERQDGEREGASTHAGISLVSVLGSLPIRERQRTLSHLVHDVCSAK